VQSADKAQAAAPVALKLPTDGLESLPLPTTPAAPTAQSAVSARPLAADDTQEIKTRLAALLNTITGPPSGEIGKAMTISWATPERYVALSDLLSPSFVTSTFASELPQDPALRDRAQTRTQALRQLLSGGEARAAKAFTESAPAPLQQAVTRMSLALQPVYNELVRVSKNASKTNTSGAQAPDAEIVIPSPAMVQMEQSLGLLGGEPDVEMLLAIVMQNCTREADADLRDLLKTMEAQRRKRADLRDQKQALTEMKTSLQAREGSVRSALEQAYTERTQLPPSDPRYINKSDISLEAFIRGQPVRVMKGTLSDVPFDAALTVSSNITRYAYAGTPGTGTTTTAVAESNKKNAALNLRMTSTGTAELTPTQRAIQDKYKLSETDMRALVAIHTADPRGVSFERFLESEVGLMESHGSDLFGQGEKNPIVENAEAVHDFMIGRAMYASAFPSAASEIALKYPEAYQQPPQPIALQGDMRLAQMRYGISERDTRALHELWKATPGAEATFDGFVSGKGFDHRSEEARAQNPENVRLLMTLTANPPAGPSVVSKEWSENWFATQSVAPWDKFFVSNCDAFWLKQMPEADQKRAEDLLQQILSGDPDADGNTPSREELQNRFNAFPGPFADVAKLWITMRVQFDHQSREQAGRQRGSQLQPVFSYDVGDFPLRGATWPPSTGPSQAAKTVATRYLAGDNFGPAAATPAPTPTTPTPTTPTTPTTATPTPSTATPAPTPTPAATTDPGPVLVSTGRDAPTITLPPADARTGSSANFAADEVPFSELGAALRSLDSRIDTLQNDMDSANELNDVNQLRLQRYMERRQSFFSTLSNSLKKMAETSSQITQNLK
jgi:hypothetical protein